MDIMTFKPTEVERILNVLNLSTNDEGEILFEDEKRRCEGCNKILTKKNFGSMLSSSKHFFCDNPVCIAKFVRETQFENKR